MKRTKVVIANWKMNLTVPESSVLLCKYAKELKPFHSEVVVCPSFTDIYSAAEALKNTEIEVGAQNVYQEDAGAYTGDDFERKSHIAKDAAFFPPRTAALCCDK